MGNIESNENYDKEIDNSKDKDNLNQSYSSIESIPNKHHFRNYFFKREKNTSEDTINTNYQEGIITSQTSLNTLINENNFNNKQLNLTESSSSLHTPEESTFKVNNKKLVTPSKLFAKNHNNRDTMDIKKLSRSTSNGAFAKINKKISQSNLFARLAKKDNQSKNSSKNVYPKDNSSVVNNNSVIYSTLGNSSMANKSIGNTSMANKSIGNTSMANKSNYSVEDHSSYIIDSYLRNNPSDYVNDPYTNLPRDKFNQQLNGSIHPNGQINNNDKMGEISRERKMFHLSPYKSKSTENLRSVNLVRKDGSEVNLLRTKSNSAMVKKAKARQLEKARTAPSISPALVPDAPPSIISFATTANSSSSNSTNQFPDEEERRIERVNELKRIFQIEEERKRRKEQEEREKRYVRKETCGSDDFDAYTGTSVPKRDGEYFQELENERNRNANGEQGERKYSVHSAPLTPTTRYLTTITQLLPNEQEPKDDYSAKEDDSSPKEDHYSSFEFESEDEYMDVLAPYSDQGDNQGDDDNFDRKSVSSATNRPYYQKRKSTSSTATGTSISRPSTVVSMDNSRKHKPKKSLSTNSLTTQISYKSKATTPKFEPGNPQFTTPPQHFNTTPPIPPIQYNNTPPPMLTNTPPPMHTNTPPPLRSTYSRTPPVKPTYINYVDEPFSIPHSMPESAVIVKHPPKFVLHAHSAVDVPTRYSNDNQINAYPRLYSTGQIPSSQISSTSPYLYNVEYSRPLTPTLTSVQPANPTIIPANYIMTANANRHRHYQRHPPPPQSQISAHDRSFSSHSYVSSAYDDPREKESILPDNILSQNVLSQNILPQNVLPQNVLPQNIIPQNVLPQNVLPQNVLPQGYYIPKEKYVVQEKKRSKHKFSVNSFKVLKKIGEGKYSKVYVANLRTKNIPYALKVLPKTKEIAKLIHQIREEIKIQLHLNHRNVLRLYDYFRDEKRIFLVLEYAPKGSVLDIQKRFEHFTESLASKIIKQTADGLEYIHSKNIVHRDLKPENLLVSESNDIKISDFGCAVFTHNIVPGTLYGTLDYFSPEMIESKMYDHRVDIFALGVIMYELLVGKTPFDDPAVNNIYRKIKACEYKIPNTVSRSASDLISNILVYEPENRYSIKEILGHPWIFKYNVSYGYYS